MTQHNTTPITQPNAVAPITEHQAPMADITEAMRVMSDAVSSMSEIFRRIDRGGIAGYAQED